MGTLKERPAHLRTTPVQARSAATVEAILAAARKLLVEHGLPSFNTNAVAKAAGVNVATLYHYFPHKVAILRELFHRDEQERTGHVASRLDELVSTDDVDGWVHDVTVALVRIRRSQPAGPALRRACRAIPELSETHDAVTDALADQMGDALQRRFPRLSRRRTKAGARVIAEATAALLDFAAEHPTVAAAIVAEMESLIVGYIDELAKANLMHVAGAEVDPDRSPVAVDA